MKLRKFIFDKQRVAEENDKEDSAVILLLEHVLNVTPSILFTKIDEELDEETILQFDSLFNKYLYDNKPIQYLIGSVCFYGYDFIVNEDVLIPRCETEELVSNVLFAYDKYFNNNKIKVCDVATGSGCIGITLKKEAPNMDVTITDISKKALDVAKKNSEKLAADVNILCGDMLEPLEGKFDILVSNPPYIPDEEFVMSLVKDNEPNIALFGGKDGLKFYNIILRDAKRILNDNAIIAFEHGYDKKNEIETLAKHYFPKSRVETLKDYEGRDRMTLIYLGDFANE